VIFRSFVVAPFKSYNKLTINKLRFVIVICVIFSWPDSSQHNVTNSRCLQDIANKDVIANDEDSEIVLKEKKEEKDDPEYLERLRAMDEYKDTHRRGWGNRANRS